VRLFDQVTAPFTIYAFVTERHRSEDPLIRAFREFVFAEMPQDARPPVDVRRADDGQALRLAEAGD